MDGVMQRSKTEIGGLDKAAQDATSQSAAVMSKELTTRRPRAQRAARSAQRAARAVGAEHGLGYDAARSHDRARGSSTRAMATEAWRDTADAPDAAARGAELAEARGVRARRALLPLRGAGNACSAGRGTYRRVRPAAPYEPDESSSEGEIRSTRSADLEGGEGPRRRTTLREDPREGPTTEAPPDLGRACVAYIFVF